jgi:hypothetical protein
MPERPTSPKSTWPPLSDVRQEITDAIAEGAPLFNNGDIEGCYNAYLTAAELIVSQGNIMY